MNYENASDTELEDRLADLVGFKPTDMQIAAREFVNALKESEDCMVRTSVRGYKTSTSPNYCTDWNATMPLAVEHRVCLKSPIKANEMWVAIWNECGGIWTPNELQTKSKSPLRAIVICLIKVLESK